MRGARRAAGFPEIFLVAFAGLLLEIAYTRVFSFKVSSAFTYLLIGFALLGAAALLYALAAALLPALGPPRTRADAAPGG